jgi:hypothetical protein
VFTAAGGQTEQDVLNSWIGAWQAGHEIGNHSWDHASGGNSRLLADWNTTISQSNNWIVQNIGLQQCELIGWRFPYLAFDDDGFKALAGQHMVYDNSIEFGYDFWQPPGFTTGFSPTNPEYGKHYWWPFTLDNGLDPSFSSTNKGVQAHAGLWEFPVHAFTRLDPADNTKVKTITGLDSNVWTAKATDASIDFCGTLKYSFDQRYNGNRSPLSVGCQSDIYSQNNPTADTAFGNTYVVRRLALKCFVDYVLTQPDARIVRFRDVIEWMRSPKSIH